MVSSLDKKISSAAASEKTTRDLKEQAVSQAKGSPYHIVERGDTLYGIAKKYGLSVDELIRLNQLKSGQAIYPGQKILVSPKAP